MRSWYLPPRGYLSNVKGGNMANTTYVYTGNVALKH